MAGVGLAALQGGLMYALASFLVAASAAAFCVAGVGLAALQGGLMYALASFLVAASAAAFCVAGVWDLRRFKGV